MINVGVIGLGAMGQNHVRVYSQLNCQLVGVADADIERAKAMGEMFSIPYYQDYHDLLHRVEAVSIAVPTILHRTVAVDFLNEGVHCLVEKPIAFTLNEASEMIDSAERSDVNLAVGHIEQFNPAVIKLKEIIDRGKLGKLLIISTRRVGPYVPRIRDIGIVVDSATHDIGVVNYLLDRLPLFVYAKVGSLKHLKEDHAIIVLDYGKTAASIEVNWFTPHKIRTLVATGSEGIAYLDYIEQKLIIHNSHEIKTEDIKKAEPLKLELEDFLNSIQDCSKPVVNSHEAKEILRIALASKNSTYVKL